ncbi:MAG: hypothetical protein AAGD14_04570 [Planctomycetota bacterium]
MRQAPFPHGIITVLLVTGFEPFGGLARNPSGDLALALGDAHQNVQGAVLPVDYRRIEASLDALLQERWEAVVLLGVAVGRSVLSLEKVAINYRDPQRPDNEGFAPADTDVVPGGPDAYFSTLPLARLRDALTEEQVPHELSLSAGPYLCNASMYLARHKLGPDVPCGFIHVPPTPDLACGAPPMEFELQKRGIGRVLGELGA